MNVTRFAIEKSRITLVLLAVLLFAGMRSYSTMPQAEDPGFIIRFALVLTYWPGASPERVEQLVTDPLEKAIQEIPELDAVTSQSKTGVSIVSVGIKERYQDMRPIWDNLRRKIQRVSPQLPEGAQEPIVNDEYGDVFGTVVALTGDGYSYAELKDVADEVRDELLLIEDVAKVEIFGAQEERVFVDYSNARLADLGLAPSQIRGILEARNIVNSGGDIRTESEEIVLEPTGNFESVQELERTLIPLPQTGELVYLEDVAQIYRGYLEPPETRFRANGEPGLCLAVAMREGGNIVALGQEVQETVERVEKTYPHGVRLDLILEQGKVGEKKVDDFVMNLVQAVAIVMLVMFLPFSLGLRTGLVVAALIPSAIIVAFLFMPLTGIGIDQLSLAALIISLGLLVDNAIVMSESIMVQMGEGKSSKDAAIDSAKELAGPLLVSSLTTASAFLPIYLAKSAVGEYTRPLFIVVTITLLCSWCIALTVIPLLCHLFLKVQKAKEGVYDTRFYRAYRGLLLLSLRNRLVTLVLVIGAFVGSLMLFRFVPVIFFPDNDRPTLTAEWSYPVGTPLSTTEDTVGEIETFIREDLLATEAGIAAGEGGVSDWITFLGEGGPRFYLGFDPEQASPGYAMMIINATDYPSAVDSVARIRRFGARFPDLKMTVEPLSSGPPGGKAISIRISGREQGKTFELVESLKDHLRATSGPVNISDDWGARSKKLVIEIDDDRAQRAGVTHEDIARTLQTVFSGYKATEYREGDKTIPVTLRSEQASLANLEGLGSINVFSQATGRSVPVQQVAASRLVWEPGNIRRRDRLKTVTVEADLEPGYAINQVIPQVESWLESESRNWPLGYSWEVGGEDEASAEANQSIGEQLPVAGVIILLLLVVQFNSLRRPMIILLTIPLGLIGVVIGLLVMRSYFGFMTLLGVISLAGIVINNAIVLIDRIDVEIRDRGLSPQRAVIESAQRRLRPILLTTFTTLGGMIPLYLGGGPLFESMAVAIMFGLVFATVLTLGVVPLLYSLFFRVRFGSYEH